MNDINKAIELANEKFESNFSDANSGEVLSSIYTNDGKLLPPNNTPVSGKENIKEFWYGAAGLGIKSVLLETVEVNELGEYAVEEGAFTMFGAEKNIVDQGKYIVLWKLVDGAWMYHKDIWNSNLQATA